MIKLKKKLIKNPMLKFFFLKKKVWQEGQSVLACEGLKNKPKHMGLG
jgi:hypothetical protein